METSSSRNTTLRPTVTVRHCSKRRQLLSPLQPVKDSTSATVSDTADFFHKGPTILQTTTVILYQVPHRRKDSKRLTYQASFFFFFFFVLQNSGFVFGSALASDDDTKLILLMNQTRHLRVTWGWSIADRSVRDSSLLYITSKQLKSTL